MAELTVGLLQTKKLIVSELERMQATGEELVHSSKDIADNSKLFSEYGEKLAAADSVLTGLKRRCDNDSMMLWYSFLFFVAVCAFIVLKRLSLLLAAVKLTCFLGSWVVWSLYAIFLCLYEYVGLPSSTSSLPSSTSSPRPPSLSSYSIMCSSEQIRLYHDGLYSQR
eukprot:GHVQ01020325.1.p1 GENE.GHVQ01020325.1~~GHVQ01020325.1.p1  ORF type:complete len:167 (+),score=34.63 GHVQ01020325.1:945-1445(+)